MREVINKIKLFAREHEQLCRCAAVFAVSVAAFMAYILARRGSLIDTSGDGTLYISVADNFVDNGHFIQTLRTTRDNMVVPFGLPALMVPFRLVTRSYVPLMAAQYIMYGMSNVFAHLAERNFLRTRGVVSLAFLWAATFYRVECSPAVLACTEVSYMFLLFAGLYVLSRGDMLPARRVVWLNVITFLAMVIRPFLAPLYVFTLAYTLYSAAKRDISRRALLPLLLIPAAVMTAFVFVNHRECGRYVLFQNYSSLDTAWANSEQSQPLNLRITSYYSYLEGTTGIDYARDSDHFSAQFREYLLHHPGKFVRDTMIKFFEMYVKHWFFVMIPVAASAVLLLKKRAAHARLLAAMFVYTLVMGVVSSMSIMCHRYTVFAVPFWGLLLAGGVNALRDEVKARRLNNRY